MIRRVSHLTLVLVALAAVVSSSALASGGKPKKHHSGSGGGVSAVSVYTEGGPNGGKGPALSGRAAAQLQSRGGKDARALLALGSMRAFGHAPSLPGEAGSVGHVSSPGAFLAALDLGAGPIALFVTLLAGATAFGLGRVLRRRRASH